MVKAEQEGVEEEEKEEEEGDEEEEEEEEKLEVNAFPSSYSFGKRADKILQAAPPCVGHDNLWRRSSPERRMRKRWWW